MTIIITKNLETVFDAIFAVVHHRLWTSKEISWRPYTASHNVSGGQKFDGNCKVRVDKCPSRYRAEPSGRHGVSRLRTNVLQQRLTALARSKSCDQETEVRENKREEDVNACRHTLQGTLNYFSPFLCLQSKDHLCILSCICFYNVYKRK